MEELNTELSIDQAMSFAITLAKKGLGFVEPNPAVGCVILDSENKMIGYGFHEKYGELHAEVNALSSVQDKTKLLGAKVIVTLEPCGHKGKTPPCSQALIDAKVGSVIYGVSDANPLFNHAGIESLKNNKITVEKYSSSQVICDELFKLVDKFLYAQENKKTFVSIKMGMSLDGQIALQNKKSKWITNNESRQHSHYLRATHQATLVGVETLLVDNPKLNIRLDQYAESENKVIILDPKFRSKDFLASSELLSSVGKKNIYIASNEVSLIEGAGYNFISVELNKHNKIDLNALVIELFKLNINSILVEGGAGTISEFLNQTVFNQIFSFIAPSIIGSGFGLSWTNGLSCQDLNNKIILDKPEIERFGDDILLTYKPISS